MRTKINSCCSGCCGLGTFLAGLIYLLLTLALLVYCYIFVAGENAAICKGNVSLTVFVTITDIVQITLLLTSGCLGMVASRAQTDSLIEGYLVMSTITFFISSISMVQSAITVYSATGGDLERILSVYDSVSNEFTGARADGHIDSLAADLTFLVASTCGFIFSFLSSVLACKAVCSRSAKVNVIRDVVPLRVY